MPVRVVINELPGAVRDSLGKAIAAALRESGGDWNVSLTSNDRNSAWDVELNTPGGFHWARRFSGGDRDGDVIAAAIRSVTAPSASELDDALSALAGQGIAFTDATGRSGEREYIVDRVRLRESEIVRLHHRGALTIRGIRTYLLTRRAA